MDIVRELRDSNALLRSLSRCPDGLPTVSLREAERIQGLLRTNRIDTLALAELAEAVDESHFNDEDTVSLLNAVANTSTETHAPVGAIEHNRTKSQDWSRVIHKLLPDTVWKSMVNERVDHVFEFLGRIAVCYMLQSVSIIAVRSLRYTAGACRISVCYMQVYRCNLCRLAVRSSR